MRSFITGVLCIFLTLFSQGCSLQCYQCSNVESETCGVDLVEHQFQAVQCRSREDKCAIQVQKPAQGDDWVGVLRGCYESGMIGDGIGDSEGCRSWTNRNGYTAFYCFCHTDGCNGDQVRAEVEQWLN